MNSLLIIVLFIYNPLYVYILILLYNILFNNSIIHKDYRIYLYKKKIVYYINKNNDIYYLLYTTCGPDLNKIVIKINQNKYN